MPRTVKKDAFKPLPGFPWKGKFEDMKEVHEYFSHDRLQCLLCGRDYAGLGTHIVWTHNIDVDAYKAQFGLPWSWGLNGKSLRERQSRTIRKTRREGRMPYAPPSEHVKKLHEYKRRKNRTTAHAIRNEARKRVLQRLGLDRKWEASDYEEFLRRIKTGRTLQEVETDDDMPAAYLFQKHMRKNLDFKRQFQTVWDNLPFVVQLRGKRPGSRLKMRLVELRLQGHTLVEVGRKLGLSEKAARSLWFKIKNKSSNAQRKTMESHERSLRHDPRLFDEYLRRIAKGRTPSEVGRDEDMPGRLAFDKHVRENPAFRKKYDAVWDKVPFSVQVRGQRTSRAFKEAVISLRTSGLSWEGVARKLGVNAKIAQGLWTRLGQKGTEAERKIVAAYTRKLQKAHFWSAEEMDEFLRRIKSGRTPAEVACDKDMPRRTFFDKYVRKNPAYEKRYQAIWESLPFSVQVRGNRLGERFKKEVARLKRQGLSNQEIGKILGIKRQTVNAAWFRMKREKRTSFYSRSH